MLQYHVGTDITMEISKSDVLKVFTDKTCEYEVYILLSILFKGKLRTTDCRD